MDKLKIRGGIPLRGAISIGGAKNASLPLMAAHLLTTEPITLLNIPHLADIHALSDLLKELGSRVTVEGSAYILQTGDQMRTQAPYDFVRKMRASVMVLGPLLAHYGHAEISLPGGCAIGARPVDLHLKAMEALGAQIVLENGHIYARSPKGGLRGGEYVFPIVSVTGTKNMMMAATLARGTTRILNAAREPEVCNVGEMLIKMGARIEGLGTDTIVVDGVTSLRGATHRVMPDRIETGTYAIAAAITGGDIHLLGANPMDLIAPIESLQEAGVTLTTTSQGLRVQGGQKIKAVDIRTAPHPGYPTDLQAQFMALMCVAEGASVITETIFENRFMHAAELARMGADIQIHGSTATVRGVPRLMGAPVMATDLRASVAMVLAGLAAEGETIMSRLYHLDRGYEHLEEKLGACGSIIERIV